MTKTKDIDYLFLSARVKAMERNLLNRERLERMLDARTNEDAAKVLTECGYAEMPLVNQETLDQTLVDHQEQFLADLTLSAPDKRLIEVFKVRYDYHNVKVLLKSEAMGSEPDRLLNSGGRVSVAELAEGVRSGDMRGMPAILQTAVAQARDVLGATGDPQLADFVLDRAYFSDMFDLAKRVDSPFLEGYVRIAIDAANLRSVVRTMRMEKGPDFLRSVLFDRGNITTDRILNALSAGGSLEELYATSVLKNAAEAGVAALSGGPLTRFEKLCDNAVSSYLAGAKYVAFGEAPLIGYLAAKETELTAIRIVMMGRMAGLDTDTIRERLRESYV